MVGSIGVYRSPAGVPEQHLPSGKRGDPKARGALYFDLAAIPLSVNSDGSVNLRVYGDPIRDGFETKILRNVVVTTTPGVGLFWTVATVQNPAETVLSGEGA